MEQLHGIWVISVTLCLLAQYISIGKDRLREVISLICNISFNVIVFKLLPEWNK